MFLKLLNEIARLRKESQLRTPIPGEDVNNQSSDIGDESIGNSEMNDYIGGTNGVSVVDDFTEQYVHSVWYLYWRANLQRSL